MKQYRIALLCKEFPFLDQLFAGQSGHFELSPTQVDDIKINKGDNSLLSKKGFVNSYEWSGGESFNYTKYFAVSGQNVLELNCAGHYGSGWGERHDWEADSVGEQLFVENFVPDYIVECVQNGTDNNGNGKVTRFWTIFKMRKFDLVSYHKQNIDEAATQIKAEIAAVQKDWPEEPRNDETAEICDICGHPSSSHESGQCEKWGCPCTIANHPGQLPSDQLIG